MPHTLHLNALVLPIPHTLSACNANNAHCVPLKSTSADALRSLNLVFMLPSFLLALVSLRRNNSPITASTALVPAHTDSVAGGAILPQFQCSPLLLYQIQTLFRSSPPLLERIRFFSA